MKKNTFWILCGVNNNKKKTEEKRSEANQNFIQMRVGGVL